MNTVNRKALMVFTHFVPGFGMVHGNPGAEDAAVVKVPEEALEQLVGEGKIADEDFAPVKAKAVATKAVTPASDDFTITYQKVGKWVITGPGMPEPEVLAGKKAVAEARVVELRATLTAAPASDDAPVD